MNEQVTDTSNGSARRIGGRAGAVALSVGAHLILLPVLLLAAAEKSTPPVADHPPMIVSLIQPPKPPPAPDPAPVDDPLPAKASTSPSPPSPAPPAPEPQPARSRPAHVTPPASAPTVPAGPAPSTGEAFATVGEGQLAGATRAGSGSGSGVGGGSCDMVRRLQDALRADPDIRTAVSAAQHQVGPGRALLLWNGSWVRSPGQSGNGLAGVRQAIAVEVAFAPEVCRERAMRGLVLLTFADGAHVALGGGQWRWGDLLRGR